MDARGFWEPVWYGPYKLSNDSETLCPQGPRMLNSVQNPVPLAATLTARFGLSLQPAISSITPGSPTAWLVEFKDHAACQALEAVSIPVAALPEERATPILLNLRAA
jgi:hypothetical protein